jgi:hypothetical protein
MFDFSKLKFVKCNAPWRPFLAILTMSTEKLQLLHKFIRRMIACDLEFLQKLMSKFVSSCPLEIVVRKSIFVFASIDEVVYGPKGCLLLNEATAMILKESGVSFHPSDGYIRISGVEKSHGAFGFYRFVAILNAAQFGSESTIKSLLAEADSSRIDESHDCHFRYCVQTKANSAEDCRLLLESCHVNGARRECVKLNFVDCLQVDHPCRPFPEGYVLEQNEGNLIKKKSKTKAKSAISEEVTSDFDEPIEEPIIEKKTLNKAQNLQKGQEPIEDELESPTSKSSRPKRAATKKPPIDCSSDSSIDQPPKKKRKSRKKR